LFLFYLRSFSEILEPHLYKEWQNYHRETKSTPSSSSEEFFWKLYLVGNIYWSSKDKIIYRSEKDMFSKIILSEGMLINHIPPAYENAIGYFFAHKY
jgi:hypothetical protein